MNLTYARNNDIYDYDKKQMNKKALAYCERNNL